MRIARYASAISFAYLLAQSLAAPVDESSSIQLDGSAETSPVAESDPKQWLSKPEDTKYFHEPGGDDILGHYDIRYFHGIVSYEERTHTLQHMIRAYLGFFSENGLETWIAHGTLLGWWWNGKILPWDWDIDTQVSDATLRFLAQNLNRTTHHYVSADNNVKRDYLLDVNPWAVERDRGDGMNIIDARWIDIRNGLYVDITGLSETHPEEQPGVWSCKNFHKYSTSDLYPMRDSVYEGVPAKIPYAYDKILQQEYRYKALVLQEYEGHRWDSDVSEWIKTPGQIKKKREEEEEEEEKRTLERLCHPEAPSHFLH